MFVGWGKFKKMSEKGCKMERPQVIPWKLEENEDLLKEKSVTNVKNCQVGTKAHSKGYL